MLKIIKNPDKEIYDEATRQVKECKGQCPCVLEIHRNEDTKCPCKDFREQTTVGECHCGRFVKVEADT